MRRFVVIMLALAACADWPDAGGDRFARTTGPWPELVSVAELYAALPEARPDEARRLEARAGALRARAALLRRDIRNRDDMEALRARLAR